jgi:hypothetical protein
MSVPTYFNERMSFSALLQPDLCGVHPSFGVELLMQVRSGCQISVHEHTSHFARCDVNDDV